jgi:hypothetical protein
LPVAIIKHRAAHWPMLRSAKIQSCI